jgi:peptidoglycan hydrolase-like protein with peptidoglycan-binding domain
MEKRLRAGILAMFLLASPFLASAQGSDQPPDVTPKFRAAIPADTLNTPISSPGNPTAVSCPSLSRNLSISLGGNDVIQLQHFLIAQTFLPQGDNTGYFGRLPQAAAIQFQGQQSLPTTGFVGPLTRAAIAKVCGGNQTVSQTTNQTTNTNQNIQQNQNTNVTNQVVENVGTAPSVISLSPTSGPVGFLVTISGSGFTKGSYVNIGRSGAADSTFGVAESINVGSTMAIAIPSYFSAPPPCPNNIPCPVRTIAQQVTAGTYEIEVINASGISNKLSFTVAGSPTSAHIMSLSPSSGPPGTHVTVSGSGLSPIGNNLVNFYLPNGSGFGWNPIAFNDSGTLVTFDIPPASQVSPGPYSIDIENADTNLTSNQLPFIVTAP